MPELPEVETTRRGIEAALKGRTITGVTVRNPRLRQPVPPSLGNKAMGQRIDAVNRRAKYLLIESAGGSLIIHLGMSGNLRICDADTAAAKHDHVDILLDDGHVLRYHDPRRFGFVLWADGDPLRYPPLAALGPEPLEADFTALHLYQKSRGRRRAVRDFLLDGHIVAGIGNIYANEALFVAGIDPRRAAGRIAQARYARLHGALIEVLRAAIEAGGTTLKDFRRADGRPGYFQQQLRVYGRAGLPCPTCATPLRREIQGQRSLFFCPRCQH